MALGKFKSLFERRSIVPIALGTRPRSVEALTCAARIFSPARFLYNFCANCRGHSMVAFGFVRFAEPGDVPAYASASILDQHIGVNQPAHFDHRGWPGGESAKKFPMRARRFRETADIRDEHPGPHHVAHRYVRTLERCADIREAPGAPARTSGPRRR